MMSGNKRVLVWDWTVRAFHWLTVLLVALLWWSAEEGMMDWHKRFGLCLLGLLVFRIVWGLIGSQTARFANMPFGPRHLGGYLSKVRRGDHRASFGHNPAGVLSVAVILIALATQVTTGLFSVDVDGLESGPLATLVSFETGRQFAEIHEMGFNILLALIGLHVIAIMTYLIVFRDNLVRPMLTGRRARADFETGDLIDNKAKWFPVILAVMIAAGFVFAVLQGARFA